jgi:hypothetical protein
MISTIAKSTIAAAHRAAIPARMLALGALALTLAACGGGAAAAPQGAPASNAAQQGGGRQGAPPGAFGTIAAVNGSTAQVQGQNSQTAVNFGQSTRFTQVTTVALADVTNGSCALVTSTSPASGQTLTAATVVVVNPGQSACNDDMMRGGAFPGFGNGGGGGGGRGNGSRAPRPSGAPSAGANVPRGSRVIGTVGAAGAGGFTVHGVLRGSGGGAGTGGGANSSADNQPATDVAVTVDGGTTYSKVTDATAAAVVVGQCMAATGKTDDIGAVTADSVTITKPGTNGCSFGFGGAGRGRNGGAGGNGGGAGSGNGGNGGATGNGGGNG